MKKVAKLVIMLGIALGVVFVMHIILLSVSEEYFKGWHAAKKDVIAWKDYVFAPEYVSLDAALEHMCVSEETIEILTFDRYAICLDQYGIVGCTVIFPTKGNRWKALPMHAFRRLFRCVGDARRNKLHILLFEHGGDILVFGELHSQESEEIFTDSTARSYPTYVYYESGSASQIPFFKHCTFFTLAELEAGYSIAAGEDSIDFDGTQWSYDLNGNPAKINCAACWRYEVER